MKKTCKHCTNQFEVTDKDLKFYEKMGLPGPSLCMEDMSRLRLSFRNEVDLYKRKCDKTGKEVITYHPPHAPYPVYDREIWWGDSWDPLGYGQDYDPNRSFLEQLAELDSKVPKASIYAVESENSDYTNYATHNKNCYLIFGSWFDENCLYGNSVYHSLSCIDCHFVNKCQWCYQCIDCNECYETAYSQNSQNCATAWFLFDCKRCQNCIGCWNLKDKKYHIWNKPVSKEEFEKTLNELKTSQQKVKEFWKKFRNHVAADAIHRGLIGEGNENVSGNFIYHSKNITNSYNIQKAEDIAYSDRTLEQKDQYFCSGVHYGELAYNSLSVDFSHNIVCCMNGEHHTNTAYCLDSYSISDCLGCIGLRHKKYCILNKQYSEEEYKTLSGKIKDKMLQDEEWGEYFLIKMDPFFFNKTVANEYFPLSKDSAITKGYRWKEEEEKSTQQQKFNIPDNVQDCGEDICKELLVCEETGNNFQIIPEELKLYKRMGWPIPRVSWDKRYQNRLALRMPRKLFQNTCSKCNKKIETNYSPDRPEKVYCEECYLKEVY